MKDGLFKTVVEATSLPQDPVQRELGSLLAAQGFNSEDLTIDQLRDVMIDYLNSVFLELADNDECKSA